MKVHVIGGGIIGSSIAYFLAENGVEVTVFEKDRAFSEASFARSCGGVRSQFYTPQNILMSRFSVNFIKNVARIPFTPNGYLMLFGFDREEDYKQSIVRQQDAGATTKVFTAHELEEKYPWMYTGDIFRACYTDDGSEGWIDPVLLHNWYRERCNELGVKFEYRDGSSADHKCDKIVIASGCWSAEVAKHFVINLPIKGHKHTLYNISTASGPHPHLPLIADLITGIYVRPDNDNFIVGFDKNAEWDAADLEPNMNAWEAAWESLYHRGPEVFQGCRVETAWAGYYDSCTLDGNPVIDNVGNVYFATGFTGRGLMHSPAVGMTMMQLVTGQKPCYDLSCYKLNREPKEERYVI